MAHTLGVSEARGSYTEALRRLKDPVEDASFGDRELEREIREIEARAEEVHVENVIEQIQRALGEVSSESRISADEYSLERKLVLWGPGSSDISFRESFRDASMSFRWRGSVQAWVWDSARIWSRQFWSTMMRLQAMAHSTDAER